MMKRMRASVFAMLACAMTAPALAQQSALVSEYDEATIRQVASELDLEVLSVIGMDHDEPVVRLQSSDGLYIDAVGVSCWSNGDARTCLGVMLAAYFGMESAAEAEEMAVAINNEFPIAKATSENEKLVLSRYVVLEGGVSFENVRVEFEVFEELGYLVLDMIGG